MLGGVSYTHRHAHLFTRIPAHPQTQVYTQTLLHTQISCTTYVYQVSLYTCISTVTFVFMCMDYCSLVKAQSRYVQTVYLMMTSHNTCIPSPPPPPPFQTAPPRLFCIIPFQPISHCAVQCADYFCPHPAEADSDVSHPIHQFEPCPPTKRLQESGALPQGPEPAQTRQVGYQPAAIIHTIGTVYTYKVGEEELILDCTMCATMCK